MNYARQFDPAITAPIEEGEYGMLRSGGVDEDLGSASAIYSSAADFIRSLPREQLNDELRRWVVADNELM